jgi:hypothetical protein
MQTCDNNSVLVLMVDSSQESYLLHSRKLSLFYASQLGNEIRLGECEKNEIYLVVVFVIKEFRRGDKQMEQDAFA